MHLIIKIVNHKHDIMNDEEKSYFWFLLDEETTDGRVNYGGYNRIQKKLLSKFPNSTCKFSQQPFAKLQHKRNRKCPITDTSESRAAKKKFNVTNRMSMTRYAIKF